ncbi:HSP70/90 co-chaperone [Sorochytrium milnesiophthora]
MAQVEKQKKPQWTLSEDNFLKEMDSVPLFMSSLPEDAGDNAELAALQSLIYDGTPEEIATNFKNQGNEMFRDGKQFYKHAIQYYTQGLQQKCSDSKLNSALHSNRAAVNLELGNYRQVLLDCQQAIKLDSANVKAFYRAARALFAVDKFAEAAITVEDGLRVEADNKALIDLGVRIKERQRQIELKELKKRQEAEDKLQRERAVEQAAQSRGIKMVSDSKGASALPSEHADYKPSYDASTDTLSFPAVVLYPEHNQTDFIAQFDVATTFEDQLQPVLEHPAPWDPSFNYRLDNIDVYFVAVPATGPRKLVKVGKKNQLQGVLKLSWASVVNGTVEFVVLPRSGTDFTAQYIADFQRNK